VKNYMKLAIEKPCSENFDKFKKTAKGGFCDACKKEVVDFTNMNDAQIKAYFTTHSQKNTCGKFKNDQLKAFTIQPPRYKRFGFLTGISMAFLSLFAFNNLQAQKTENKTKSLEKDPFKIIKQQQEKTVMVSGTILDDSGPLPGTSVVVKGTTNGTQTDFDGNFSFSEPLKKGDILVVSNIGYESKEIVISDENSASTVRLNVSMHSVDDIIIMGEVAVKKVYQSKN
jgi:hypothetical protein